MQQNDETKQEEKAVIQFDKQSPYDGKEKLSHFIQVTQVTTDDFCVQLDVLEPVQKNSAYIIKNGAERVGRMKLRKNVTSIIQNVDFDYVYYQVAIYTKDGKQRLSDNVIKICQCPEYLDDSYKPNSITLSSVIKILDEKNQTVHIYWNTPTGAFGKI
eukprot:218758_1